MRDRDIVALILVIALTLLAAWIVLPIDHPSIAKQALFWQQPPEYRDLQIKEGLDLQGGTQILLQAAPPAGQNVTPDDMNSAKAIVERRVNGLGVSEPLVQSQGNNRIIVELPGINNPDAAVQTLKSTGQLEFVEIGDPDPKITDGTYLRTTNNPNPPNKDTQGKAPDPYPDKVFKTIMTGRDLQTVGTGTSQNGAPDITFSLKPTGSQTFADYTSQHVGKVLAIVLDNVVLSAPSIQNAITDGSGVITGKFTLDEAKNLAIQMRYGSLPVPLEVVDRRTIGATLGADSVTKSITAGIVGLIAVLLFMIIQYRVPGVFAAIALIIYALLNLALYKLIPVTLTLPGIAGFLLSTGMAVDANILIFERMKEELRWGRSVQAAFTAGFHRAWPSIRDSNFSTIISCIILGLFGSSFGAQAVMGFAITLGIGVVVSMFTAVVVTRTFMTFLFETSRSDEMRESRWLLDY
jgi:preprotein translocase subunit SecD